MKASDLLVKCFENEDVQYTFGIPDEENIDILDSLVGLKIQFITLHIQRGRCIL